MKRFIFFARVSFVVFYCLPLALEAQEVNSFPNYVVIGAFAHHKNAINFTGDANRNKFPAVFEMNPNRKLYYVYVLSTSDRAYAIAEAVRLRSETKYFDTWVYSGPLGSQTLADGKIPQGEDINPLTGQQFQSPDLQSRTGSNRTLSPSSRAGLNTPDERGDVSESITPTTGSTHDVERDSESRIRQAKGSQSDPRASPPGLTGDDGASYNAAEDGQLQAEAGTQEATNKPEDPSPDKNTSAVQGPPPKRMTTEPLKPEDVLEKNFYFHLFRADNANMIEGEVDAIDFARSRKMATYPGNQPVAVKMPSGKDQHISFLCQVFGYRKQQKEFDPTNPENDLYLDDKGNVVVPFELMRLQKGDIAIMYNVFFFKDAAVMRPESRYEVNNLLALLEENPSYKIKIHGHTNGNASGKIIRMETPGNFYSLSGTKQGVGSAKKLSEERASVIREFLISSGIQQERMQLKAWGGKKPIHDKLSARAHENVRVEIEILPD